MAMRDRARQGLVKRLIRAGVQEDIAMAIAVANYPTDDPEFMSIWSPRVTGKPTWGPTAAFLDAPSRQGLQDLMVFLFGFGPNEYMQQPLREQSGHDQAAAADSVEDHDASRPDGMTEQVLAKGGFRFGGDREPVAALNVASDDFDADLGWCLAATAAAAFALSKTDPEHRASVVNDLARTLLLTLRGLAALDDSTLDEIEDLPDETLAFAIRRDEDGDLVVDFSDYDGDERPAELVHRVAYQMAFAHIRDPAYDKALIMAGGYLLDAADADPDAADVYARWEAEGYVRSGLRRTTELSTSE